LIDECVGAAISAKFHSRSCARLFCSFIQFHVPAFLARPSVASAQHWGYKMAC
jgi:hypothetical protein